MTYVRLCITEQQAKALLAAVDALTASLAQSGLSLERTAALRSASTTAAKKIRSQIRETRLIETTHELLTADRAS